MSRASRHRVAFALMAGTWLLATAAAAQVPLRSGLADMSPALQALQRDDARNPAMLWVADGQAQWSHPSSRSQPGGRSCASCHGEAATSMRGAATRHPAWDAAGARPVSLAQRIEHCRVQRLNLSPRALDAEAALGLEAFVAMQSRGMPLQPVTEPALKPWLERGAALWQQRFGQLDLACVHCHDQRAGLKLAGATIPQGHANGYPLYRLEWQTLGPLQRRLRACLAGVRAEPFAPGADEWLALEVYLRQRGAGLPVETPAVRP
ncbi:MAG: sulfur oxidation c-type cytochrome SoxA [Aquabacterium sp.]